jgi:hypothetical protein
VIFEVGDASSSTASGGGGLFDDIHYLREPPEASLSHHMNYDPLPNIFLVYYWI